MNAHIVNIGDELLIGQVVNTNASWMAEQLNAINIDVTYVAVIADSRQAIEQQLNASLAEADMVLVTGGLGPTKDDITKTTICNYLNAKMVVHQPTLEHVEQYFISRNLPFTQINRDQALVPDCCTVVMNKVGTAPCMWFDHKGKIIVSMPGVPFEMKWLMTNHILPKLSELNDNQQIVHRTINTFGIGESFLAQRIEPWEDALPENIKLAYLPDAGKVRLRLTAHGNDKAALLAEVERQVEILKTYIADSIYSYDNDTIVDVIAHKLTTSGKTLTTAESCTGGLLANKITQIPGASNYYVGGNIVYSNELKINTLGVNPDTIAQYGAVSEQTAREMAEKSLTVNNADYAIATTGIAGPDGATDDKPLGLVYIAVASRNKTVCNQYTFQTTRQQHQERTANRALFDLWELIK